jgi:hypothetical protein
MLRVRRGQFLSIVGERLTSLTANKIHVGFQRHYPFKRKRWRFTSNRFNLRINSSGIARDPIWSMQFVGRNWLANELFFATAWRKQ